MMNSALPQRLWRACLTVALAVTAVAAASSVALAQAGVVRVLLFYSPSCIHCEKVREDVLPPLKAQYGEQLEVVEVDASRAEGHTLFSTVLDALDVPAEGRAYPTLIVGDHILVGSIDIPAELPGLVAGYARQGGVDLPAIAGLADMLANYESQGGVDLLARPAPSPGLRERFMRDPVGNSLSVAVLLALLASLVGAAWPWAWQRRLERRLPWALPLVTLAGLGVAYYLGFVELAGVEAVCGPVGDCNAVQQSSYALLLGAIPVGVFGAMGYLAILFTWSLGQCVRGWPARLAKAGTALLAGFGVLFSAYLTFLEPFVIGATCAWCLSSALCMALILLLSAGPGWEALGRAQEVSEEVTT